MFVVYGRRIWTVGLIYWRTEWTESISYFFLLHQLEFSILLNQNILAWACNTKSYFSNVQTSLLRFADKQMLMTKSFDVSVRSWYQLPRKLCSGNSSSKYWTDNLKFCWQFNLPQALIKFSCKDNVVWTHCEEYLISLLIH